MVSSQRSKKTERNVLDFIKDQGFEVKMLPRRRMVISTPNYRSVLLGVHIVAIQEIGEIESISYITRTVSLKNVKKTALRKTILA